MEEMIQIPPDSFLAVFAELWALPAGMDFNDIMKTSAFRSVRDYGNVHCYAQALGTFGDFPLGRGLRQLGLPCFFEANSPLVGTDMELSAGLCYRALMQTHSTHIYLCPLDNADCLPRIRFANAEIREFTRSELEVLLNIEQLRRHLPCNKNTDTENLARFTWLVVKEEKPLRKDIAERNLSFLIDGFTDIGSIFPYRHRYPESVDKVLFLLMLAPWEEWVTNPDAEWRSFNVPWVHTVDSDIFTQQQIIRGADTLTWVDAIYTTSTGEPVEEYIPHRKYCDFDEEVLLKIVCDQTKNNFAIAVRNGLINTAALHQFVKAFMSEGIDEFLAHIVVIDACMGEAREDRKLITDKKDIGLQATGRLKYRLAGLLNDASVKENMTLLYDYRSKYVHGRDIFRIISSERNLARKLAREMLLAIIELVGLEPELTREQFLIRTLANGNALIDE
ncbi:hypothetical protein [Pectobacterium carotovorum]|uniref:hypothetical protein n=1 Tax=Pectobacterium carotovorum TaxID=554 RepID=UPI0021C26406|nr:hypothetical protein [Pectobacterium carotovorum]GKW07613.1 hypothetical protein PEC301889_20960 [Pectobacterium carotovorum subsp. carotovorum]